MNSNFRTIPLTCTLVAVSLGCSAPLLAQPATAPLLANGDFETAGADNWPDKWGHLKEGASYETENGNHFLRLTSPEAGKMILMYEPVNIPEGVKALDVKWRQRVANLKRGKNSWFDARIMMNFKDVMGGKEIKPGPPAPNTNKDTDGWVDREVKFLVPDGAKLLEFMPTLFQVESGTFDLDDISITPTEPGPLEEEAKVKADAYAAKVAKQAEARQTKAAANVQPDGSFIANGDFQADANGDNVPDNWPGVNGNLSYEKEGDNRFLRITSTEPGKLAMFYRTIDLPAGVKALELSWKQRISNLKVGQNAWFDARILLNWKDAAGNKMEGSPPAPYSRQNTDGWVSKTTSFLVPDGAVTLEFMPSLFQVQSGTFDLDEITLKPADVGVLQAAAEKAAAEAKYINVAPEAPNPAKWPQELHVVGNKVLNKDGKTVVLRGVNIDSMQWNPRGERILRSSLVAIEDWKADILRLPVKDDYWFGREPGQTDGGKAYRALVDAEVNLAANRGAYVLLDLHRFRAPNTTAVEFWKDAATHFKNHPAVIFELFNEPHSISWDVWRNGGFVEDKDAPADEDAFLTPEEKAKNAKGFHSVGIQALVDAVRSTGAKNIVVAGGLDWSYDLSGVANGFALDQKDGNGLMYSTHIYAGKRDWKGKVLVVADKYPLIVSEFGANTKKFSFIPADAQEDAVTWVPRVLGFIDKYNLNYTAFSFHPASAPQLLQSWDYTPTPEWGAFAKRSLAGEKFPDEGLR